MPTTEQVADLNELAAVARAFREKCAEFMELQDVAQKLREQRNHIERERDAVLSRIESVDGEVAELRCRLLSIASGRALDKHSPPDERYRG